MNRALVDRIADAVLYEGYILYPYRPSVKNRQRWTFGGLYPAAFCQSQGDAQSNQTECLIHGSCASGFEVVVRFLHLTDRRIGATVPPLAQWPHDREPPYRPVESLNVDGRPLHSWQEAEEREVVLGTMVLGDLLGQPCSERFSFAGGRQSEPIRNSAGQIVGILVREQQPIAGSLEVAATEVEDELFRITVRVVNRTPWGGSEATNRDAALLRSLVSTHAILGVRDGKFVSLLDPPDSWRASAVACRNVGTWPVLVGPEGQSDTMLSSPIILYDYPQVAPESPGDFFDGTEIDEMLTLRILTLTDEEKQSMLAVDERAGALLARTEAMAREQLLSLHGRVRSCRLVPEETTHD
jgi:hydrogenase maturation protease